MKIPASNWPSGSKAACVKTFAERVLELTDKYSIDSYRHRTLSTSDKAFELQEWVGNVRKRLVPKPTLEKMIDEYDTSLISDPVIEEICRRNSIPIDSLRIKVIYSLEKMSAALKLYANLIFPKYSSVIIELILETAIAGLKGKRRIIRLAEHFIPHVISGGKSREFVHLSAKREFFICPEEISEEERLRAFFKEVSRNEKTYEVLICCDRDFANYICSFLKKEPLAWSELPNFFKYSVNKTGGKYVHLQYRGDDPFSVVRSVKFLTEFLKSFSLVFPTKRGLRTVRMMFTYDFETGEVYKVPPEEFLNMGSIIWDEGKRSRSMMELAKFALGSRSEEETSSTFQIVNALLTASSASKLSNQNACLASIWSAFEALLPTPMKDGEKSTRITYFADIITPLATTSYTYELFHGLYSDLARNFRAEFLSFVDRNGTGESRFEKFLSVFYLSKPLKREFTEIFSDCHIFRIRAMELDEIANSPNKLRRVIQDHDKRVLWQVHRIYRERNSIMHRATSSKYSRSLIENTFSYFKGTVLTLIRTSERYGIRDIEGLIELCLALNKKNNQALRQYQENQGREALFHSVRSPIR